MLKTENAAPTPAYAAKHNFAAVDFTRVVMAFLIVALHCSPLTSYSAEAAFWFQEWICRLCVPYFFLCSGFFLFSTGQGGEALKRKVFAQLKKLLLVYAFWSLAYLPYYKDAFFETDNLPAEIFKTFRKLCIWGSYFHLWYLPAAMLAIFITWFLFSKKLPLKYILLCGGVLYIFGLMDSNWFGLARQLPLWRIPAVHLLAKTILRFFVLTRNGLFFGFIFVALGAHFARNGLPSAKKCAIGFALSMAAGLAEIAFVRNLTPTPDPSLYAFLPFAASFLFCAVLQLPGSGQHNTKNLRKFSSLVFLSHKWFIDNCLGILGCFFAPPQNSLFKYCAAAAFSALFAFAVIRLSGHRRFARLKMFY